LDASKITLADCVAATSDLDLGKLGDADGLEEYTLANCANSPELDRQKVRKGKNASDNATTS